MAAASPAGGRAADAVLARGWPRLAVRRLMICASSLPPAACLLALARADRGASPARAVALLALALCTHSCATAGYHGHIQDVAPASAGALLGLTNTIGIFASVLSNVATSAVLERTGSYGGVFALTAALYTLSAACFCAFASDEPL